LSLPPVKPCPYCGQMPAVKAALDPMPADLLFGKPREGWRIRCANSCHWAMPRWRETRQALTLAWNEVVDTHNETPEQRDAHYRQLEREAIRQAEGGAL